MDVAPFDPVRALKVLTAHGVRFVAIGGFAARLWGSPSITNDLDICYARDRRNLNALAAALRELHASLRGVAEPVSFRLDARTLEAGDHFTFVTDAGNLDCLGTPAGSGGFNQIMRAAAELDLEEVKVHVAALDDLIRMKRAAGRAKDLIEVEVLSALRDEIDRSAE